MSVKSLLISSWRKSLNYRDRAHYRLSSYVKNAIRRHRSQKMAGFLKCAGVHPIDAGNMNPGWVHKKTSLAELAAIEFLRAIPIGKSQHILHMGVGNGDFARSLSGLGAILTGVTIDGEERAISRGLYEIIHLVNKYAVSDLAEILGDSKYHWIVDVNLFSWACCYGHAMRYMWLLNDCLLKGGGIVTSAMGAKYSPTGVMLTPLLLERLAEVVGMRVTEHPDGLILITRK
jgi:hypothetical protein